ncbi:MAG TPA: hypothetical protein VJV39_14190 [Dongiaceae bacterium]|nr:hypothetical protein [Dongiaceae bacterium]
MTFLEAAVFSIAPVLLAILVAALILPRTWLAFYGALVIVAVALYSGYSSQHEDEAMRGLLAVLFRMLMMAALAAGLATRWALKHRPRETD